VNYFATFQKICTLNNSKKKCLINKLTNVLNSLKKICQKIMNS
jgi:hypothetical protein